MFDERELKFELGDGDNLDLPPAVEKALLNMEKGEEALFTVKPKYAHGVCGCVHVCVCVSVCVSVI